MSIEKSIASSNGIKITKQDKRITQSEGGVLIRREDGPTGAKATVTGIVYLLLDCSGSMRGNKINQAKQGALSFAKDALFKGYLTGLIRFDSVALHLCDPQPRLSAIQRQLQQISAGGSTNMTEAIELAIQRLMVNKGTRVIVIATDGMPDNENSALQAAEQAKKKGIDIIAIGTDDANHTYLKKLASRTTLGIKVSREQFQRGIASAAESLPLLDRGRQELGQKGE